MFKTLLTNVLHNKFLEVVIFRLEVTLPMRFIRARQDLRPIFINSGGRILKEGGSFCVL